MLFAFTDQHIQLPYKFNPNLQVEFRIQNNAEKSTVNNTYSLTFSQTRAEKWVLEDFNPNLKKATIKQEEMLATLYDVWTKLIKNSKSIDVEIQAVINKEFWNLI